MVTTRNTTSHNEQPNHNDTSSPLQNPDNLAQQLSSIASKLNALDALAADVAVLKAQAGPNGPNRATYPNASSLAQSQNWESERQNLWDKGLCFRCKEKFAPGHRCKLATFLLLEISNDNEQLEDREVEVNENEYEEGINQQDMAEISFHAILRKTSGTTMKVEGTLEDRKVLTLVDSGSTHNFISALLVKQLGLKKYKLQGVSSVIKTDASFQSYSKLPDATSDSLRPRVKVKENQRVDALSRRPQHHAGQYLQFCLEDKASF
ncbi:retrotransposon gag domain, retroviral aspartyl protease [Tanacetum coccineum]|uniref:Retrotransposon gag domain, retroviral aspartyl protease n=1 Tax=Tanacetum coccineum TaxID=301880 RepID=A0ABQ5GG50_9ASTR